MTQTDSPKPDFAETFLEHWQGDLSDVQATMKSIEKTFEKLHALCDKLDSDVRAAVWSDVQIELCENSAGAFFVAKCRLPTSTHDSESVKRITSGLAARLGPILGWAHTIDYSETERGNFFDLYWEFGNTYCQVPTIAGSRSSLHDEDFEDEQDN